MCRLTGTEPFGPSGENVQKVYVDGKEFFSDDPKLASRNLTALGWTAWMFLTINYFKGTTQANVIAKSNNTNNMGFTLSDMMGMLGSGGGGMGGGGFGGLNMGSGNTAGITTATQAVLNYRDTWSKTFDLNGSYFSTTQAAKTRTKHQHLPYNQR